MQQNSDRRWEKTRKTILTIMWVTGLLMAGSDGLFMPWLNGIGLLLFFLSSWWLGNVLQKKSCSQSKRYFLCTTPKKNGIQRAAWKRNILLTPGSSS